ncbi:hypothetical protein DW252_04145, partial [Coprococcus comes]
YKIFNVLQFSLDFLFAGYFFINYYNLFKLSFNVYCIFHPLPLNYYDIYYKFFGGIFYAKLS